MLDVTTFGAWPEAAHPAPGRLGQTVTIIRAITPRRVQKLFSIGADGRLTKTAAAQVREGIAQSVPLAGLADLAELLIELSEKTDFCLSLGEFRDAPLFSDFRLVTRAALTKLMPWLPAAAHPGVHFHQGEFVAGRIAAGIEESRYLHLDLDRFDGMPAEWRGWTMGDACDAWDRILPGLPRCARLESRSSSARVVAPGGQPGAASLGIVEVSDPDLKPALRRFVRREMVRLGLAVPMAKRAKDGSGRTTGHEPRGIFDLAVWHPGRIVFSAPPDVEGAPGYSVVAAGVRMVNEGGGVLDIGWLRDDRPAVIQGWGPADASAPSLAMEWADEAPPHASADRQPDAPWTARPCTLPDPSKAVAGVNRDDTAFWFVFLKLVQWCDARDSNIVPVAVARGFYLEAIGLMRCDTTELRQQVDYKARHIVGWFARDFVPNQRQRSAPKTEAERLANRRAGQAQGAATQNARSIAKLRAAIEAIREEEGREPTKGEAAKRAGMNRDTAAKHWEAASGCVRNPIRQHKKGCAALPAFLAPAPSPPPAAPADAAAASPASTGRADAATRRRPAACPRRLPAIRLPQPPAALLRRLPGFLAAAAAARAHRPAGRGPPPW